MALACLVALQLTTNRLLDLPGVENDRNKGRRRMGLGVRVFALSTIQVLGAIGASELAGTPLG